MPRPALDCHRLDSEAIEQARQRGQQVFYGDCSRAEILRALGVDRAALVLITLNDAGATERALIAIRQLVPQARVIARAHDPAQAHTLRAHGVLRAVPETIEYSLQFGLRPERTGRGCRYRQELEDALRATAAPRGCAPIPPPS
jgi:voltage-gated potassium channel Kch